MVSILGDNTDVPEWKEDISEEDNSYLHNVIHSLLQSGNRDRISESLQNVAALIALLFVSDCCHELDMMIGLVFRSNTDGVQMCHHNDRLYPRISPAFSKHLAELTVKREEWPFQCRVDVCNENSRVSNDATFEERMKGLMYYYRGKRVALVSPAMIT